MSSEYTRRSHLLNSSLQVGRYSASRSEESYASKLPTSGALSTYLSSRSTETDTANDDFKNYDSLLRRIRAEQAESLNTNGNGSTGSYLGTSPSRYSAASGMSASDGPRESFLHSRHQELMKSRRLLDNNNYLGATAGPIGNAGTEQQQQQEYPCSTGTGDNGWRPTYSVRNIPVRSLEEVRETIAIRRQYYRERLFGKNDEESGENSNAEGISTQEAVASAAITSESQISGNDEKMAAAEAESEQAEPLTNENKKACEAADSSSTQEQNGPGDENEQTGCITDEAEVATCVNEPEPVAGAPDLTEDKPAPDFNEREPSIHDNHAPTEHSRASSDTLENTSDVNKTNLELGRTGADMLSQPEQTPEAIAEISAAQAEHTHEILIEITMQPEQEPEICMDTEITAQAQQEAEVIPDGTSQPEEVPEAIIEIMSQFEKVSETIAEIIPEQPAEQEVNADMVNSSTTDGQTLLNIEAPSQDDPPSVIATATESQTQSNEVSEEPSERSEQFQAPSANMAPNVSEKTPPCTSE